MFHSFDPETNATGFWQKIPAPRPFSSRRNDEGCYEVIEYLPIVDGRGNVRSYEYMKDGRIYAADGSFLRMREKGTKPSEASRSNSSGSMSPSNTSTGGTFKPPPDWASAAPFVPSEMNGTANKPTLEWANAKEFVPSKGQASNRTGNSSGSSLVLSKIQEFIPNGARDGKAGSRPLSSLIVADLNKIKEFVPRPKNENKFGDISKIPEFVPRDESPVSLPGLEGTSTGGFSAAQQQDVAGESLGSDGVVGAVGYSGGGICPYFVNGSCRFGDSCSFVHGKVCEYCNFYILDPYDQEQNDAHRRECMEEHERDMELSFAVAHSASMTCSVCLETILEKQPPGQQRFGILPACNHCFCLSCIRTWRQSGPSFENKVTRGCPVCRTQSDFVVPSRLWIDAKEEKTRLITNYKGAVGKKPCRYFKGGAALCPFGNKCFYLHALPNGTLVDVGPPRRKRRERVQDEAHRFDPLFENDDAESWIGFRDFLDMFEDSDEESEYESLSDFEYDVDSP